MVPKGTYPEKKNTNKISSSATWKAEVVCTVNECAGSQSPNQPGFDS